MNDIQTLMRSANPIPDAKQEFTDGDVKALLTLTLTRSGDMDVKEIMTPVEPDRKRNGWFVAAAAFGAVIIVAGLALLLTRSTTEELPPATTPTTVSVTPTTVAPEPAPDAAPVVTTPPVPSELMNVVLGYETAFNEGDEVALRALFAPGAVRVPSDESVFQLNADVDGLVDEMVYYQARGSSLLVEDCSTIADDLSCVFVYSGPFETAAFQTSVPSRMRLVIADGQIAAISAQCGLCTFDNSALEDIIAWAGAINPADSEIIAGAAPFYTRTAEAGALWLTYAEQWREFDGDANAAESLAVISAFESAWNAGDADVLEALFTPGITIPVESSGNPLSIDTFLLAMTANQAREETLRIEECRSNGESVTCEVYIDGAIWEALYLMPGHSRETYKIVDGQFVEFEHRCLLGCDGEFDARVVAWVRTISAADADEMAGPIIGTTTGPAIGALWLKYAPLWNEAGRP
jgi:hypothetical protein